MKKILLCLFLVICNLVLFSAPTQATQKTCPVGESRYRPGGDCERTIPSVYPNLANYPLTCQDIPLAKLSGKSRQQPDNSYIRNITSDISQAELGGLGPNATTLNSYSPDAIAQIYPFNALFDKPISMANQPREAARTYWRILSTYEQANAKAAYFQLVKNNNFINNTSISFYNSDKSTSSSTPPPTGTISSSLGINIGYGHIDQKFCDDASGRPATFLVPLNASEEELRRYQSCYSSATIRVIRVTDIKSSTADTALTAAGARFSAVFNSDQDYLVLGNELNDPAEYGCSGNLVTCGEGYARQFDSFKNTYTGLHISAAPVNTSHTNQDAAKFLDGARQAYINSNFLANNTYQSSAGCVYDPIRCGKDSYKWVLQYLGVSLPVLLTEYGLAPPNDDRSLINVLNFYTSLPTDLIAITPLIRNVCSQAKGDWLHFDHANKLVDLDGKVIDPTTCNGTVNMANDEVTVLDLAGKLPGCLTQYPVCADFTKKYLELPLVDRSAYDALLPFNFDNVRGYQVLNKVIYKENLPYVRAIVDGLNNNRSGLLNLLSPSWINSLRRTNLYTNSINSNEVDPSLEPVMKQAILDRNTPEYAASNCLIHDNSTYLPSPLTFPNNFDGTAKLTQEVEIPVTVTEDIDPLTGIVIYRYKGQKDGKPVTVINNPKLADLSTSLKGEQSLTALFLPGAGFIPNRDLAAPIANLTTDNDDTTVEGKTFEEGQARVARTGGESQTQLCELRNQWLIPANLQKGNINCTDPFKTLGGSVQGPAGPPASQIPTVINCNSAAPASNPGKLLSADQLIGIGYPSGASKENIKLCYNDIVSRSNASGYDPALTMAIWLEESGASWYSTYPGAADFGCTVGNNPRMDFTAQLSCFLNLKSFYATNDIWKECRGSDNRLSLREFFLIYEGGYQSCRADEFTIEEQFPQRIKDYYRLVTGGQTLDFALNF